MAKLDTSRDYYADLELPPTADVSEIKKQFRKLALLYHPDRNPGREAEVNSKFQIIQSAHEILTDPEQRSKYDSTRSRSRYPTASGVRGNPWQDVGNQYPAPPRRQARNPPPPPPSGASKYRQFTSGTAPTAKNHAREDPMEAKRNAWHAFEHMRPGSQGRSASSQAKAQSRPVPPEPPKPPRPVPRTPGQKQKAESAFGRKSSYAARSPVPGDEFSAGASGYSTNRQTPDFHGEDRSQSPQKMRGSMPDPLAQFRDRYGESRQSTPYSSGKGEKTNPFDGVSPRRTPSTRDSASHEHPESEEGPSQGGTKHRSSSAPRNPVPDDSDETSRPRSANAVPKPSAQPFASRAGAKYTPPLNSASPAEPSATGNGKSSAGLFWLQTHSLLTKTIASASAGESATKTNGPSMYEATQPSKPLFQFQVPRTDCNTSFAFPRSYHKPPAPWLSKHREPTNSNLSTSSSSPSGGISPTTSDPRTPIERQQHDILEKLISNAYSPSFERKKRQLSNNVDLAAQDLADNAFSNSFNFNIDDDTFAQTRPSQTPPTRSSADDINTRFVDDENSEAWHFSAGSPVQEEDPSKKRRGKTGSRVGRQSPIKRQPTETARETAPHTHAEAVPEPKWNAQSWSEIGAQNFAPQPAHPTSTSPSRPPTRTNSRKPKAVHPTMGSAGLVNEESSSSSEEPELPPRPPKEEAAATDSPIAMDIDTPPQPAGNAPQATSARNIHVEPSRPEWRSGDVQGVPEKPQANGAALQSDFNPNAAGSEDSDEFRASFADLKNVAPFAQKATGLGSFGDLESNLPFESRASNRVPVEKEKQKPADLAFPAAPRAPIPPAALAVSGLKPSTATWQKYAVDFQNYMQQWDAFNAQVTDHFNARKQQVLGSREAKGYSFLTAQSSEGIFEYLEWIQQDKEVRKKWTAACEEHELRVRDFLRFREHMQ